nr:nucleolar protein dao-5-like [Procambarus clarkii]XP_045597898.1 nucleolar protein dao-5-like [Procambarus clarkii]
MARGCDNTNMNHNNPTQQQHLECDVPTIHIKDGGDDDDEDDDDAQVFLQHLGTNYGITARSKTSRRSITLSKEESRVGSAVSTAVSRQKSSRTLIDVTTRLTQGNEGQLYRLLSAKRNHIQELSSDVIFLHNRIKELEEQNRLLVRMGKRQEAALTRYQDTKSELPHIIEAHKIEINVLQEKLRRSTEVNRRNGEKLKVTDSRVNKLTDELTRLRELSRKRNLPEREELNRKLSAAAKALQDKEKELEGARRRLAVLEKSLRQQVQAEVGRHRATAKKLYTLQCQHHKVLDTLLERERELESLQQYRRRSEGAGESTSTTAASSRSPSLSARRKSGRKHSSESSDTNTSGIVSAIEAASSESRASLTLEASGRLPPISAGSRGKTEAGDRASLRGSPEAPARRLRLRTHSSTNEGVEERRRVRRSRRSPRSCKEEGFIITPLATPTPSPVTTPEPSDLGSQPDANAVDDGASRPGHTDHRRRLRLAASLRDARRNVSKEIGHEKDLDDDQGIPTGDRDSSGKREFSLIENYPPRERITLNGGSSGGSDSGSCTSSPPTKSVPHLNDSSIPSRLSQLDSPLPARAVPKRENTATSADLRTFSSLSKLDSSSSPKPTRSAVTP